MATKGRLFVQPDRMMLLQVPTGDTSSVLSASATAVAQAQSLNLIDLVAKGGWVMLPIAFLLMAALFIIFQRYLLIRAQTKVESNFIDNIRDMVLQGNIKSAESFAKNQHTSMGRIFERAIGRVGSPIRDIENTIENISQIEIGRLERNLGYLGIIAGIAPMFGFIGTISGIIRIFYDISLTDNISVGIIAGGLYEKMITSGAGLVVGVLAYTGYHLLNMMIERFTLKVEMNAFEFLEILQKPVAE